MTDVLSKITEEETNMNHIEEEDDEETRDFYIYILSREHPTVLTPVPNPYKRSDRIREANAELQSESPKNGSRSGTKIRFNDTPMLYEYVKQEDILSLLNGDLSPHEHNHSSVDENSCNNLKNADDSNQTVTPKGQNNAWSNDFDVENQDINNRPIKKEIIHLEEVNEKSDKLVSEIQDGRLKTVTGLSKDKSEPSAGPIDSKINHKKCASNTAKNEELNRSKIEVKSLPKENFCSDRSKEKVNSEYSAQRSAFSNEVVNDTINHTLTFDQTDQLNENQFETTDNIDDILKTSNNNTLELKNLTNEDDQTNENHLLMNSVKINPIVNNPENKLNYRPSSTERIGSYNKSAKPVTSQNGKTKSGVNDKEEKIKSDPSRINTKTNGSNKKNQSTSKNKLNGKRDINETSSKTAKPQANKTNNTDSVKAQGKDHSKVKDVDSKNSARIRPTRHDSIELKEPTDSAETTEVSQRLDISTLKTQETESSEPKNSNELLLSTEEVKSKLEEIKERNRSKLVVLVPPFEQYKSYMNDNYSDSDDNESFDLEEFLRKEDPHNDLNYLPDFELESDNELDKLCKDSGSLNDLGNLYPESMCSNHKNQNKLRSMRKKGKDNTNGKNMTRSLEDDELRRHQCKMMNNIKSSQPYENSVKKLNQDSGGGSGKCKQKCPQRPSTAPGGRKFGCDCKWPRIKLPEYNGLRSEYGLSAEQLCERKRQRQEITKRMRERRQRKMDEEERRKMENERMFHEWLLKKRQQAKEQWMRNQRLRAMRYSRQCITPNQSKPKLSQNKPNTPLAIRKKLHPGRNCFSLDEIINDVTEHNDDNKTYKIYLGLSIE
ncbi:hypothetical protein M8J75_003992 [Diaphorina citri]|nr:hypothetical protein M8J75_003992 [Diaphorina citri]